MSRARGAVVALLTNNLADLPFDLQSSISQRGSRHSGCHYVGNSDAQPEDPSHLRRYSGSRREEFLVLAPWVVPDGPRDELRDVADRLAPGSGDELENDYLETALIADLPFPPKPSRRCRTANAEKAELAGEGAPTRRDGARDRRRDPQTDDAPLP